VYVEPVTVHTMTWSKKTPADGRVLVLGHNPGLPGLPGLPGYSEFPSNTAELFELLP